jgi:hypothetical protein
MLSFIYSRLAIYLLHANRPVFKGSAPINLSDRFHQVLRRIIESMKCEMFCVYRQV